MGKKARKKRNRNLDKRINQRIKDRDYYTKKKIQKIQEKEKDTPNEKLDFLKDPFLYNAKVESHVREFLSNPQHNQNQERDVDDVIPDSVIADNVILDTNAIMDSIQKKYLEHIHQLLNKNKPKIILTDTTLKESIRKNNTNNNTLMKLLEKSFGKSRFKILANTPDIVADARKMQEKYEELHNPDDNILAVAKKLKAAIITNDAGLKECCKKEEIEFYDHRKQKLAPSKYQRLQTQRRKEKEIRSKKEE